MKNVLLIAIALFSSSLVLASPSDFFNGMATTVCQGTDVSGQNFELTIYQSNSNPESSAMISMKMASYLTLAEATVQIDSTINRLQYDIPSPAAGVPAFQLVINAAANKAEWSFVGTPMKSSVDCKPLIVTP